MPNMKKYPGESEAAFKKRMNLSGNERAAANKAAANKKAKKKTKKKTKKVVKKMRGY
tara:strand:+ start:255 stop:425 length:171 start_codon:yes stop_codon:yes gene_type:complete